MMANIFKRIIGKIFLYVCAMTIFIFTVFPFIWSVLISFRQKDQIFAIPPKIISLPITFENYIFAIKESSVLIFCLNSIIVAFFAVMLTTLISMLAAYSLSRFKFKGKGFVYLLIALTQVFPIVVVIIPLYMVFRSINLYNTLSSLIIAYTAISVPLGTVMMIRYLSDIPKALEDSAKIDGCNNFKAMVYIILPLARPGIVATAIYIFINVWQEYLIGTSLIGDSTKYTLTVGLSTFRSQHSTEWGGLMATAVIITIPAMIAFVSVQKQLIDNLAGSIKG